MRKIAIELNATNILGRLDKAKKLARNPRISIAIMGPVNSGKTTLINGILGQEVQEPSLLPYEGKPLRIAFERIEENPDYNCTFIFHKEWINTDAVIYELPGETVFDKDKRILLDEIDFIFYLMPANHFMTAKDKEALTLLRPLPVQIIATKMDEVSSKDQSTVLDYIKKSCEALNLSSALMADDTDWPNLSQKMRDRIILIDDLKDLRKAHAEAINAECRGELKNLLDNMISQENEALKNNAQKQESARRAAELEASKARQKLSAIELQCTKASNEIIESVHKIPVDAMQLAAELCEKGKRERFSKEFGQEAKKQIEDFYAKEIRAISKEVSNNAQKILADAKEQRLIDERAVFGKLDETQADPASLNLDSELSTSTLLKTVGVAGAVSLAAIVSPAGPATTAIAAIAALGGGGVVYAKMHADEKNKAAVKSITDAIREGSINLESQLIREVLSYFNEISHQLRLPETTQITIDEDRGQNATLEHLKKLAQALEES